MLILFKKTFKSVLFGKQNNRKLIIRCLNGLVFGKPTSVAIFDLINIAKGRGSRTPQI